MAAAIVYDLNKEKDKMLTFYSDSGDKNYWKLGDHLRRLNNGELNCGLMKGFWKQNKTKQEMKICY